MGFFRVHRCALRVAGASLVLLLAAFAVAANALVLSDQAELGAFLVDGEGMSVYLYLPDEAALSNCYDACAEAWPPVAPPDEGMFPGLGDFRVGEGVDESLVATVERADGTLQITYGGWPLYYFIRDEQPGDAEGHKVNDQWFLVTASGGALGASAEGSDTEDSGTSDGEAMASLMDLGNSTYGDQCSSCHGAQGDAQRNGAIVLAGYGGLENTGRVIRQVLYGSEYMPSFVDTISNEQVAAVLTYVRNSWGNEFGVVTEEEVVTERAKFE